MPVPTRRKKTSWRVPARGAPESRRAARAAARNWIRTPRWPRKSPNPRWRLIDLWGIGIGIAGQIVIVVLYLPFQHDIHDFNAPSQKFTGASHGGGFLIIAVATVIAAP